MRTLTRGKSKRTAKRKETRIRTKLFFRVSVTPPPLSFRNRSLSSSPENRCLLRLLLCAVLLPRDSTRPIAQDEMYARLQSSRPFFLFAGPNVIESRDHTLFMAHAIKEIASRLSIAVVFKASFDKANRTCHDSYRGPGLDAGLKVLDDVKRQLEMPIVTDIHEPWQAAPVAEVAEVLQIPAFLCRQTDLIVAAARTQRVLHVKKGQWVDSSAMAAATEKALAAGNSQFIACERGTQFGYGDLVVDPRNLHWLRSAGGLVSADITHSLQQPGGRIGENGMRAAGGLRELIPTVARAACAAGVDGLFMEVRCAARSSCLDYCHSLLSDLAQPSSHNLRRCMVIQPTHCATRRRSGRCTSWGGFWRSAETLQTPRAGVRSTRLVTRSGKG